MAAPAARLWARLVLAVTVAGTAVWSSVLLDRSPHFLPWLRWAVLAAGLLAAVGLLVADRLGRRWSRARCWSPACVAGLGGPAAYALRHRGHPAHRLDPQRRARRSPARFGGRRCRGGAPAGRPAARRARRRRSRRRPAASRRLFAGGARRLRRRGRHGRPARRQRGQHPGRRALEKDASSYTWVAAAVGANNAAGYQLATQLPVMPLGGFNGSDPSPTLAQFQHTSPTGRSTGSSAAAGSAAWPAAAAATPRRDRRLGGGELHRRRPSTA